MAGYAGVTRTQDDALEKETMEAFVKTPHKYVGTRTWLRDSTAVLTTSELGAKKKNPRRVLVAKYNRPLPELA